MRRFLVGFLDGDDYIGSDGLVYVMDGEFVYLWDFFDWFDDYCFGWFEDDDG